MDQGRLCPVYPLPKNRAGSLPGVYATCVAGFLNLFLPIPLCRDWFNNGFYATCVFKSLFHSTCIITQLLFRNCVAEFLLVRHSSSKLGSALTRSSFQRTVTIGNMRDTAQIVPKDIINFQHSLDICSLCQNYKQVCILII